MATPAPNRPLRTVGSIALLLAAGLMLSGCSNQAIVAGNVMSMLVTFGLFYTTINLKRDTT